MEAEKGEGSSLVRRQKDVNEARGGVWFFFFAALCLHLRTLAPPPYLLAF